MSSYKKLKGFKKEREHFTRLRSTILKEHQQNHLSLRREDRNKKKLFIYFSYWHGPVQRVIISSFGFSHSVTFWVAVDLAQIPSLHPLWDCPPLAPDWRGYELQVPWSFLWLFHFLHSIVCESFLPWSQLSSFPREEGISSFLVGGKTWALYGTEYKRRTKLIKEKAVMDAKMQRVLLYTSKLIFWQFRILRQIWCLIQHIAFQNFTTKFTSKQVLALPV